MPSKRNFNPYESPEDACKQCAAWYHEALLFVARETAFWVVMFSGLSFLLGLIIGVLSWLKGIR